MSDPTNTSPEPSNPKITAMIEERLRVRLDHDLRDLANFARAVGHERLQMGVQDFGGRIIQIGIRFPAVRTGLREVGANGVVARVVEVIADVAPGAWDVPYPLGAPMVRLRFPNLPPDLEPFLSNLHFIAPASSDARPRHGLDPLMAMLHDSFHSPTGFGVPCLWRRWHPQRDLVWLACQIHSLLVVEPSTMASPNDCMDPAAAKYWLSQTEHTLPLEPPFAAVTAPKRAPVDPEFTLTRNDDP
jgi:hypothetical protein